MGLQGYFDNFNQQVRGGDACEGSECRGWFLSEVDTWHECPCNKRRAVPVPHPEEDREDCAPTNECPCGNVRTDLCEPTCEDCQTENAVLDKILRLGL